MVKKKKRVIVEVPHRISGFFEIVDQINGVSIKDPERIGSRGAGFNLNAVGKTEINVEDFGENDEQKCQIYINGELFNQEAETTCYIFGYIKNYIKKPFHIKIYHNFDLPVGCGYGASGSGALGAIFGLNYLLNLNLTYKERGRIAHIAEVVNKTGLGTVCGLLSGGLCILKEPGYPCVSKRVEVPNDIEVICGTFGTIQTRSVLNNPILNLKIKEAGRIALRKLIQNPNIKTFITTSREFVSNTNILDLLNLTKVKELLNDLSKLNIYGASMNQLGQSVYAICAKGDEKNVIEIFNSYMPEIKIFNLKINNNGPKILIKE